MIFWFVILAPVMVAEIFRSPMIDYRLVAFGALVPAAEVVLGHPSVLHTLAGAVVGLAVVVLATQRRRLVRRRLLGIPIGLLFHLVLDGSWTSTGLFWWPVTGTAFGDHKVPEFGHSFVTSVLLEAVAIAVGVWAWRRYELDDPANKALLLTTGQLSRSVLGEGPTI